MEFNESMSKVAVKKGSEDKADECGVWVRYV